jgi:hypothetical protein
LPPLHTLTANPPTSRTTVEINVAIIAASFPCLKPLFKTLFDGSSARARYGSSKYKGYMRDTDHRTAKSGAGAGGGGTGPRSRTGPDFEMYSQSKFTTDVKTGGGMPSMTGSEESILPQDLKTPAKQTVTAARPPAEGGITKTQTVFVTYEEEERRRSSAWEA